MKTKDLLSILVGSYVNISGEIPNVFNVLKANLPHIIGNHNCDNKMQKNPDDIAAVRASVAENANVSVKRRSQEVGQ